MWNIVLHAMYSTTKPRLACAVGKLMATTSATTNTTTNTTTTPSPTPSTTTSANSTYAFNGFVVATLLALVVSAMMVVSSFAHVIAATSIETKHFELPTLQAQAQTQAPSNDRKLRNPSAPSVPMSRGRYRLDSDGDVEMTIPQLVYEFVSAPKLTSWSQASLVKWSNEREHYLTRIAERCAVTGESVEGIAVSVKSSCSVEILSILVRYELKKEVSGIADSDLTALSEERCGNLKNAHVPDIPLFFKERLRMDMKEDDSDARVLQYFSDFNQIVKDNGFAAILGTDSSTIPLKKRMKQRCKLLLECIQPEMLKVEIKRLIDAGCQEVMSDDVLLYELLRERAALQQHYHTTS
ncbi:hypothetical protein FI667_g15722, partial [Globisporangium splendens]